MARMSAENRLTLRVRVSLDERPPEECLRLTWQDSIRDDEIEIHTGKGRGSRRRIPASQRILAILHMRRAEATSEWIFPANTQSGHAEASTLKKQHQAAIRMSG